MCEDFPVDDLESPTWDRKALDYLRIQLEMGVGEFDCLLEAEKSIRPLTQSV